MKARNPQEFEFGSDQLLKANCMDGYVKDNLCNQFIGKCVFRHSDSSLP